jgi:cell division protein FtsW (lipid II flippase)
VFFVLSLARYLRFRENHRTLPGLLVPFGITLVPAMLILKQPDLGVALVFGPTLLVMLIAAGAKLWHLGAFIGLGVLAIALNIGLVLYGPESMQILKPHQQDRIRSVISLAQDDDRMVQDEAYQQDKSITLIAAGGVTGYGAEAASTVIGFNRLPERHNDMIFAVVVNRWGLLGAWAMLGMYLLLVMAMLAVAGRSKDPLARLTCVGFAAMILTPATINIGMCLGLMPITGITLPFVSYGGSSLLFSFAIIGLVMNFAATKPRAMARPSFEFDDADAIYQ